MTFIEMENITIVLKGQTYTISECKFCGQEFMWKDSTRYTEDDEWRNRRRPYNLDGSEHHCETHHVFDPTAIPVLF